MEAELSASPLLPIAPLAVGVGAELRLDPQIYAELNAQDIVNLTGFPLAMGDLVDLELERVRVFDATTRFIVGTQAGDLSLPAPDVVLLSGRVGGYPQSTVFLGLSPSSCNGFIQLDGETFILAPEPGRDEAGEQWHAAIYEQDSVDWAEARVWCEGAEPVPFPRPREIGGDPETESGEYRICNLALDADWEFCRDKFNEDAGATAAYLVELIGAINTIYHRDIDIKFHLTFVRVWATFLDPYGEPGSTGEALVEFQNYWNTYMSHVDKNIAQKISGTSGGGRAFGESLCNYEWGYAVSCLSGSFPYPLEPGPDNWDLIVPAHEMGHLFGSPHTHCYDPPIDHCNNSEQGCYAGLIECPRGTIMSYCDLCAGVGTSNKDLDFHPRVITRMRESVDRASCMTIARNPCYVNWDWYGVEEGTYYHPYNTVAEGARGVTLGGTVLITGGWYRENLVLDANMILEQNGSSGIVTIGD